MSYYSRTAADLQPGTEEFHSAGTDEVSGQFDKIGSKGLSPQAEILVNHQRLTRASLKACAVAANTPHLHTPSHTPTSTLSPSYSHASLYSHTPTPKPRTKTLQNAVNSSRNPFLTRWRDLWQHEKLGVSFEAAQHSGGLAFSLQLTARVIDQLSRGDPADYLRRRINKQLNARFGRVLPYSFGFEVSPALGRLHVHGAIVPGSDTPEHLNALREALCRAGGRITGKGAARQCLFKPLTDGLGWAAYTQKAFDDACKELGTYKVTFISQELTRSAESFHKQAPGSVNRK